MRARVGVLGVLPRIGMELSGRAHPAVYGDSIIRDGSMLGLSGTFRPDSFQMLDLIRRGYFGS
jgi:hypothetical protein